MTLRLVSNQNGVHVYENGVQIVANPEGHIDLPAFSNPENLRALVADFTFRLDEAAAHQNRISLTERFSLYELENYLSAALERRNCPADLQPEIEAALARFHQTTLSFNYAETNSLELFRSLTQGRPVSSGEFQSTLNRNLLRRFSLQALTRAQELFEQAQASPSSAEKRQLYLQAFRYYERACLLERTLSSGSALRAQMQTVYDELGGVNELPNEIRNALTPPEVLFTPTSFDFTDPQLIRIRLGMLRFSIQVAYFIFAQGSKRGALELLDQALQEVRRCIAGGPGRNFLRLNDSNRPAFLTDLAELTREIQEAKTFVAARSSLPNAREFFAGFLSALQVMSGSDLPHSTFMLPQWLITNSYFAGSLLMAYTLHHSNPEAHPMSQGWEEVMRLFLESGPEIHFQVEPIVLLARQNPQVLRVLAHSWPIIRRIFRDLSPEGQRELWSLLRHSEWMQGLDIPARYLETYEAYTNLLRRNGFEEENLHVQSLDLLARMAYQRENLENLGRDRPLVLINITRQADHNRGFQAGYQVQLVPSFYYSGLFDVVFIPVSSDEEILNSVEEVGRRSFRHRVDKWVRGAHGTATSQRYGSGQSNRDLFDTRDFGPGYARILPYLAPNIEIINDSCSNGAGAENDPDNFANSEARFLRENHQPGFRILSFTRDDTIMEIGFSSDRRTTTLRLGRGNDPYVIDERTN